MITQKYFPEKIYLNMLKLNLFKKFNYLRITKEIVEDKEIAFIFIVALQNGFKMYTNIHDKVRFTYSVSCIESFVFQNILDHPWKSFINIFLLYTPESTPTAHCKSSKVLQHFLVYSLNYWFSSQTT